MDRRQRKTREAIFNALCELLAKKDFNHITVGEIIREADIGRATFYAHFETKDDLMKALCGELFCHISDAAESVHKEHRHIFSCDAPESALLHLFQHLQKNDNRIRDLLASQNSGVFWDAFRMNLRTLVVRQMGLFERVNRADLPENYKIHHVTSSLAETIRWWIDNGMKESPETITAYFLSVV